MLSLARFLHAAKATILQEWQRRVRSLPAAAQLSGPVLLDHFPDIIDNLADAVSRGDETAKPLGEIPVVHAAERLRVGYDLRHVVAEYRVLRDVILEQYAADASDLDENSQSRINQVRVMSEALDRAIADAVDRYAVERDRSREVFVSMLGHDLRAPLNSISMASQLLLLRSDRLDARELAARISTSADRMARMIADLLDFARGRLGSGLTITPMPLDLRPLIHQAVQDFVHAHPDREIRCLANVTAGNFDVEWDGDRVVQALSNLVGNAIHHGQDPVVVKPRDHGDNVEIEVRNRGSVPAEARPGMFKAFVTRTMRPSEQTGLGLGLYIVREIARAHGGDVRFECDDAETAFTLVLPRQAAPHSRAGGAAPE